LREPSHKITAESLFYRRWALTLLEAVFDDPRADFTRQQKLLLFEDLKSVLTDADSTPNATLADRLEMTEHPLHVAAHRLRRRYREALRAGIATTVADPSQIEEEIRDLFEAVAS
jgi:hypothetical protein